MGDAVEDAATMAPDFPVEFDDPADAERTWERDDMHMPFPLTPLAGDYITRILGPSFNHHYVRFGGTQTLEGRVWNGYVYFGFLWNVPAAEEEAAKARWEEVVRARIPATRSYWHEEALPELARIYESVASVAVDDLSASALAAAWQDAWAASLTAWEIHFVAIMGPYQVLDDLSDLYATAVGSGRDVEALTLVRGSEHELEEVDVGIEALAAMLARSPDLAATVATVAERTRDRDVLDREALRAAPGGGDFVVALDEFLRRHGHLGQSHDDLLEASWAEEPVILLGNLARRMSDSASDRERPSERRLGELRAVAAERAEAVRAALSDRPEDLARFETTLAHAQDIGHLTEGHNYWIDRMAQARLRTLATRIGRRLVREGVLGDAHDVFFLLSDEVADALLDSRPRHELVRQRKAELERQRAMTSPRYVGVIPNEPSTGDRFDPGPTEQTERDLLRGTGASAGVVRGPARVILTQDDFGRVLPGDVVVAPASNPSWVPVFTIAGGLVTNTGGVLSHAAVVAREFGLPAVVGATGATTSIADGRLVEIDGTAGTVRLL